MTNKTHTLRLSRIAHELRGPAGVALGAAQELARQSGGGEPFAGMMQRGLARVLRIADRLGRASALENGIVELILRPLDLGELVNREVRISEELEHKSNTSVELLVSKELVPVTADGEWVGFCLREIVANAIQHAKAKVRVSVVMKAGVR